MAHAARSPKAHHELPELPYAQDALEPYVSRETLEFHHGKHHRGYVEALNGMISGTEFENSTLEEIVRNASGTVLNLAAQSWNHSFLWKSMTPASKPVDDALNRRIQANFGSLSLLKQLFKRKAVEAFGSGWIWLVEMPDSRLMVLPTSNAENPLRVGGKALLTCDVWEHAYYIDYRNDRAAYIDAFWNVADWSFAAQNLTRQGEASSPPDCGSLLRQKAMGASDRG